MSSVPGASRRFVLHGVRLAMLFAILAMIRLQHTKVVSRDDANEPPLVCVTKWFARARNLRLQPDGAFRVDDAHGNRLGTVLQTSPTCDHIVGFSGPSCVLLAFASDGTLLGLDVISSDDTREHVGKVTANVEFMTALDGLQGEAIADASVDAVSGATLTSLAIIESIRYRLNGTKRVSLRFPRAVAIEDVLELFPSAGSVNPTDSAVVFQVNDTAGTGIGTIVRTAPVADNLVGYQGPTDTLLGFDSDNRLVGIRVGDSYDNEPYVGYVREDGYLESLARGKSIQELSTTDWETEGYEGVSGATMTSLAVSNAVALAANSATTPPAVTSTRETFRWTGFDLGTLLCVVVAALLGFTQLRANRSLNVVFQIALVGYLGLVAGNLVSQAQLVGWAKHGVPWRAASGLVVLTIAAFAVPVFTKRNLYCTHLCPHGALQQLVRNRFPKKRAKLPTSLKLFLGMLPGMLLLWCVFVAMTGIGFSLVDIEPFDAYLFRIAGWASVCIAVIGLIGSLFVPMAYCRFGCPTGALLKFLRFNAASNRWSLRDWVALSYLGLAAVLYLRY